MTRTEAAYALTSNCVESKRGGMSDHAPKERGRKGAVPWRACWSFPCRIQHHRLSPQPPSLHSSQPTLLRHTPTHTHTHTHTDTQTHRRHTAHGGRCQAKTCPALRRARNKSTWGWGTTRRGGRAARVDLGRRGAARVRLDSGRAARVGLGRRSAARVGLGGGRAARVDLARRSAARVGLGGGRAAGAP